MYQAERVVQYTYRLYQAKQDSTQTVPGRTSCIVHIQIISGKTEQYFKCNRQNELYITHTDYIRQNRTVHQKYQVKRAVYYTYRLYQARQDSTPNVPGRTSCIEHIQIISGKTGQYTKCTRQNKLYITHTDYIRQNRTVHQMYQVERVVQYTYRLYQAKQDSTPNVPGITSCVVHIQIIPGKTGLYTKCTRQNNLYSTHTDYIRQNRTVHQMYQVEQAVQYTNRLYRTKQDSTPNVPGRTSCLVHIQIISGKTGQ